MLNVCPDPMTVYRDYTGNERELIVDGFNPELMTITGNKATKVGNYVARVSVIDPEHFAVSYDKKSGDFVDIKWYVSQNWIKTPKAKKTEYEYTGELQELELNSYNERFMEVTGNKALEIGEYEARISLKDPESTCFDEGGFTGDIIIKWKIVGVEEPKQEEIETSNDNISKEENEASKENISKEEPEIPTENETSTEEKNNDKVNEEIKDEVIEIEPEEVITYKAKILQSKGGKITTKTKTVEEGENQTFTITPDEGYRIVDVKIDGESVGTVYKYTLRNVKKVHEITAEFEKIEVKEEIKEEVKEEFEEDINDDKDENIEQEHEKTKIEFEDVKEESWYFESVKYATTNGLFKGVSDNEFAPSVTMNRAMLVTVLYRLDGEKVTSSSNKFNDIEKGSYYEVAVLWATENKIVSGVSENEFAPSSKITREQLVVMLYRFANLKGKDVSEKADLTIFEDVNEISDYAKEATAWAVNAGYINGRSETILAPKETATRAEVATILMRFSGV